MQEPSPFRRPRLLLHGLQLLLLLLLLLGLLMHRSEPVSSGCCGGPASLCRRSYTTALANIIRGGHIIG